ncbi:hypothetical protein ACQKOE_16375, partial [Novosphingobium sp. NPDC080210]|uniref:hypothetical protein n=1 Tax=Novosphingobium sp. NPDC080210 TaxID=3390596 RepID=UPI003D03C6B5
MTTRAQYDIPLVLPGLPDVADACVERLVALLKPRAGVTEGTPPLSGALLLGLCDGLKVAVICVLRSGLWGG